MARYLFIYRGFPLRPIAVCVFRAPQPAPRRKRTMKWKGSAWHKEALPRLNVYR